MESVQNIVRVIGIVCRVGGLLWVLLSYVDFSSAKKNNDGTRQDQATWGMILGGSLAAFGPSLANSVINELAQVNF